MKMLAVIARIFMIIFRPENVSLLRLAAVPRRYLSLGEYLSPPLEGRQDGDSGVSGSSACRLTSFLLLPPNMRALALG
jgi:hypothetical protein